MTAAEHIIKNQMLGRLQIPVAAWPMVERSWREREFSLFGRFDLVYDSIHRSLKMLEYNADTPTSLPEASVIQWFWLKDCFPDADQFNSIHERLIDAWKKLPSGRVHLACVRDHEEDAGNLLYLADTCQQAGHDPKLMTVEDIGWDSAQHCFVDLDDERLTTLFKLYPWEWFWRDEFSRHLPETDCRFIEPAWKMLLSNKGLLPVLWELFPRHPLLLPSYFEDEKHPSLGYNSVRKPLLGREGANVRIVCQGEVTVDNPGTYGNEGFILQERTAIPQYQGFYPVIGAWVVDGESAGIGIREDRSPVTGNDSLFTPHLFT